MLGSSKLGRKGTDTTCIVPVGTVVQEMIQEQDEWGDIINESLGIEVDLDEDNKTLCLARGTAT